jgi:tetratricopeptide (TPR) repeat protein
MITSIAAYLLPLALMQAGTAPTVDVGAITQQRFQQCVGMIDDDAGRAYEEAMAWAAEGQTVSAYRCAAMALVAQNRASEGARRLDSLGSAVNPAETATRAELFSQAGNAWLISREPGRARSSFTRAIATLESDPTQLPDLLIDRARAYAMEEDWRHAEEDLSRALDIRANDALALRLRATARMHQRTFELAEADAQHALTLAATEEDRVGAALVLGHVRESQRTGAPVDEQ